MGNYICCCCPESETVPGTDPNSSDPYGHFASENTPLLQDHANHRRSTSNSFSAASPANHPNDPGTSFSPSQFMGVQSPKQNLVNFQHQNNAGPPVNPEQQLLSQIVTDSANQIIDYTMSTAPPGRNANVSTNNVMGVADDPSEIHARSTHYTKRLTSVASALMKKHLTNDENGFPESNQAADEINNEVVASEDMLSEANGVLVTEVSARAEEELTTNRIEIPDDLIVRFGDKM